MQKPLALSIALCLGLTSCQVFEKSEVWETVVRVHPGDSVRDPDPSASYAAKLHRALLEQGVEHFVVTYQYHYFTHNRDEALDTRTAVVYRDNVDSRYPWWLKDDRTNTPVWLPNGDLASQISFYIRRPAEVIEKKEYPARGGAAKTTLGMFRPATVKQRAVFAEHPQHAVTRISQARNTETPAAPKPAVASHPFFAKPTPSAPATSSPTVTKIQRPTSVAAAKPKSAPLPPPVAASHAGPFWSPPVMIDPSVQSSDPAPHDAHLEKLFRVQNATDYDSSSPVDRRKMEQLKHGLVGRD